MNLAKAFAQQPRSWILTEMALALLVIGAVDFLTPYQFRLLRIDCTFHSDGTCGEEDEGVAVHLYRIAQEAISNALKHGNAQNIAICPEVTSDGLGWEKWRDWNSGR